MSNYNVYSNQHAAWKKILTHVTLKQKEVCVIIVENQ